MSQVHELLELIKGQIRRSGMTYRDLASQLDVSESSLKRWFSQKSFNIERLDDLCRILKIDLGELLQGAGRTHQVYQLNEDQELELAADKLLFLTFYMAVADKDLKVIAERLQLSASRVQAYLIRLDQLGLIELHPGDRIVPLVNQAVRWLPTGPLHEKYGELIRHDFMNSTFDAEWEKLWLESGFVTKSSLDVFSRKFDQLLADFRELIKLDERSDAPDKINITFVAAHRPWILPVFGDDPGSDRE